jgi:hypothetical protein
LKPLRRSGPSAGVVEVKAAGGVEGVFGLATVMPMCSTPGW